MPYVVAAMANARRRPAVVFVAFWAMVRILTVATNKNNNNNNQSSVVVVAWSQPRLILVGRPGIMMHHGEPGLPWRQPEHHHQSQSGRAVRHQRAVSTSSSLGCTRMGVALASSNNGNEQPAAEDSSSAATALVWYQRVFYRFSPGSDVDQPNAIVLEERCRFAPDPNKPGYLLPIGSRTLLLRDGQVDDGEIGNDFFTVQVSEGEDNAGTTLGAGGSTAVTSTKSHKGAGNDAALQTALVCALYLASNPDMCRGRMLEISCQSGLASVLGCLGAGYTLRRRNELPQTANAAAADDILTIAPNPSDSLLPTDLELLTLTDVDEESLRKAYRNIQAAGLSGSKVAMTVLDWRRATAMMMRTTNNNRSPRRVEEYRTVVGSDLTYSYPETKELARAVANRLEPTEPYLYQQPKVPLPRFVHICCPDDREDLVYLRRLLEKGYRMTTSTQYLKLEKLSFHFQKLPVGTPESALDDLELELKDFKEVQYEGLVAQHHPDYAGDGSGELFFPMETGEYDATGGSTFLEKEAGSSPW